MRLEKAEVCVLSFFSFVDTRSPSKKHSRGAAFLFLFRRAFSLSMVLVLAIHTVGAVTAKVR
jgi:hypothetical protein